MSNVEERYARSIQSSHLEVTEFAGDVDSLIAAGWIRDGLATTLYRLRVEFDACDMRSIRPFEPTPPPDLFFEEAHGPRRETDRALIVPIANETVAARKAQEWKVREKARVAKDYLERRAVAKALALVHMKSLSGARDALGRFVMAQATRMGLEARPEDELRLSGRILDYLLDPQCEVCFGVKFKAIPGTGRLSDLACGACDGTGKRRLRFTGSNSQAEVDLTRAILADLERKMERVNKLLWRFTRVTEVVRTLRLPPGAIAARIRLAGQEVFYEVTRDRVAWTRAVLPAN